MKITNKDCTKVLTLAGPPTFSSSVSMKMMKSSNAFAVLCISSESWKLLRFAWHNQGGDCKGNGAMGQQECQDHSYVWSGETRNLVVS